ncbi:MAG TPA: hypothetical protein PKC43_05175 [Phycisphaerales bacterium]|nr:hypothetical protein [Phycisphaerales bacterium]HMP36822.1 hypothetical protein [Phycisphaerales bacterium]
MIKDLIGSNLGPIVQKVAATLGIAEPQAKAFTEKAISLVEGLAQQDPAQLGGLLQGDPAKLLSKIDLSSLSGLVGGDTAKAGQGLESVLEGVMAQIGSDGGGMLGKLGAAASKLFGR